MIGKTPGHYQIIAKIGAGGMGEVCRAEDTILSDAWRAVYRLQDLAYVHTMLGNQNEAIDGLEFLLSRPSELSTQLLRLDPRWDPLRSSPRFQALLAKYEVKR